MVTDSRRRQGTAGEYGEIPPNLTPGGTVPLPAPKPKSGQARVVVRLAWSSGFQWRRLVRLVRSAGFRWRRQLRPVWAGLAAWTAGASAHLAGAGLTVTITSLAITGACLLWSAFPRRRLPAWLRGPGRLTKPVVRLYAAVCVLVAAWVISAAGLAGPSGRAEGIAIMAETVAAFPYWWKHRPLLDSIEEETPEPVPDDTGERLPLTFADEISAAWREFVWPADGPLPGSVPSEWQLIGAGIMSDVQLRRGKGTATAAIGQAERVASALGDAPHNIVLERHPSGRADILRVTVFDGDNPLHVPQKWPGASLSMETGEIRIGPYATGGLAAFRPWAPLGDGHAAGALHSLICGTTRVGKSQFLLQLAIEYLASGVVVLWAADQQYGVSMPEILEHAHRSACTPAETMEMLRAAERILDARSAWMFANRLKVIIPSAEMPMLRIMIDEAHRLLTDDMWKKEAKRVLEHLTQMGGKVGIGVDVVTQMPDLDQLGGSEVVRSMLQAGNIVCFRTAGKMGGDRAFQGMLPVDPSLIPRVYPGGYGSAGTCYLASAISREAPARTWLMAATDEEAAEMTADAARFKAVLDVLSAEAELIPVVPAVTASSPGAAPGETAAAGTRPASFTAEDVVLETLRRAAGPLKAAEVWDATGWAVPEWGLTDKYSSRTIGLALSKLRSTGRVCQDSERAPYYLPQMTEDSSRGLSTVNA